MMKKMYVIYCPMEGLPTRLYATIKDAQDAAAQYLEYVFEDNHDYRVESDDGLVVDMTTEFVSVRVWVDEVTLPAA